MGGHDDRASTHALANVSAYDPRTDSWTNKAPLPTARHFLGQCAVALDGMIYLVGGTGPGMPGLVLALLWRDATGVLVDAQERRVGADRRDRHNP